MRVVLLLGQAPYQEMLLSLARAELEVVGVVWHRSPESKRSLIARLFAYASHPVQAFQYICARLILPIYRLRARRAIELLFQWNVEAGVEAVGVPSITVDDINCPSAVHHVKQTGPDIVLVHGTNLLREPMLNLKARVKYGFVNLHTGLSPYSRGGNCNLFMLLEGHPELVGVTVHCIDSGIDSGDIIYSARPELNASDPYEVIEARCFELGFKLLVRAALKLSSGSVRPVAQWTPGKLFLKRTGYSYRPWHRLQVNRMIAKGSVRNYLADKAAYDRDVRLVEQDA